MSRNVFIGDSTYPGIFGHLFYAQGDPPLFFINVQNNTFNLLTFMQGFAWMTVLSCPA